MRYTNQDHIRRWVRAGLDGMPYGTRAKLARALGLSPTKLTRMLNVTPGRETRRIQFDEFPRIQAFFRKYAPDYPEFEHPEIADTQTPFYTKTTLQAFRQALNGLGEKERGIVLRCGKALADELSGYRLVPK